MRSSFFKRLFPTRMLPPQIRRYVDFPSKIFIAWLFASAAFFWYLSNQASAASLEVHGAAEFRAVTNGKKVSLSGSNLDGSALVSDAGGAHIEDTHGKTAFRIKFKGKESAHLYADNDLVYRIKCKRESDEEKCKLYDKSGTLLFRSKLKSDSFNLYDGKDARLGKGKLKDSSYVIHDESEAKILAIDGAGSLKEAVMLSFPVKPQWRLLLWRYGSSL